VVTFDLSGYVFADIKALLQSMLITMPSNQYTQLLIEEGRRNFLIYGLPFLENLEAAVKLAPKAKEATELLNKFTKSSLADAPQLLEESNQLKAAAAAIPSTPLATASPLASPQVGALPTVATVVQPIVMGPTVANPTTASMNSQPTVMGPTVSNLTTASMNPTAAGAAGVVSPWQAPQAAKAISADQHDDSFRPGRDAVATTLRIVSAAVITGYDNGLLNWEAISPIIQVILGNAITPMVATNTVMQLVNVLTPKAVTLSAACKGVLIENLMAALSQSQVGHLIAALVEGIDVRGTSVTGLIAKLLSPPPMSYVPPPQPQPQAGNTGVEMTQMSPAPAQNAYSTPSIRSIFGGSYHQSQNVWYNFQQLNSAEIVVLLIAIESLGDWVKSELVYGKESAVQLRRSDSKMSMLSASDAGGSVEEVKIQIERRASGRKVLDPFVEKSEPDAVDDDDEPPPEESVVEKPKRSRGGSRGSGYQF
jgi:hypothetical protein